MRAVLVLFGLCALALAVPTPTTTKVIPKKYKIDDKTFLDRQLNIYRLFKYVNQPTHYRKEFVEIAKTFQPMAHADFYTKPEYMEQFMYYYKTDILPKEEIFSVFYQDHLNPAIALFKMFYYAKDFDTFFSTAVWAREHINQGMWMYAFSVAVVHRPDTFGMVLPPIYELYPYYFFSTEVMTKAQRYKQMFNGKYPTTDSWEGYTIESNYTGWYMNLHPEQSMSYFMEDVGLNAFYYYYHIHYPFWMDGEEFGLSMDKRGEMFFFVHQQILARYYMERLSNGFGEIPMFRFDQPIEAGYYPSLEYPNGMEFPSRPNHALVTRRYEYNHPSFSNITHSYTNLKDFSRRMRDALDIGFVYTRDGEKVSLYTENGLEMLGNMIEGTPNSPNIDFYGAIQMYARHLLGYANTPLHKYKTVPSALEHFETSVRDPMFWQFYKRLMNFYMEYKQHLPKYTKKEMDFDGVKIVDVKVDRLTTYFDSFYSHLGMGVYYNEADFNGEPFKVRVKQERLAHKPFTYTMTVESAKAVDAIGKVFIGPKYDEYGRMIDMNENRMNFFMIDKFMYKLKTGKNVITRNCKENFFATDKTSFVDVYKHIMGAIKGTEEFTMDGTEVFFGFPNRLMLPMGKEGGMPFQMYMIFYPYHPVEKMHKMTEEIMFPMVGTGAMMVDSMPYGFPFDRTIDYGTFYVDNAHFEDVLVYHTDLNKMNKI